MIAVLNQKMIGSLNSSQFPCPFLTRYALVKAANNITMAASANHIITFRGCKRYGVFISAVS
jgi:hypothetical protein